MPGEIHAVLGENGAGKSTLMKVIYGSIEPDAGQMMLNGVKSNIRSLKDARYAGISMVFQHFNLFDTVTVAENVWLGLAEFPEIGFRCRSGQGQRIWAGDRSRSACAYPYVGECSALKSFAPC